MIRHFFVGLLLMALIAITFVSASAKDVPRSPAAAPAPALTEEELKFQELLNSVEPASLHEVLHEHMKDKYQHGVYQEDRTAIAAVHQEDAEVARSLIELAKRQVGASTNGTSSATGTSSVTQSTRTTSVTENSTVSRSQTTASTTAPTSPVSASSTPTSSTGTPSSTGQTTTFTKSTTTPTSSTKQSQTSSMGTTSNKSTSTTAQKSITQQMVTTSTAPNGAVATITSITIVPAPDQTSGDSSKTSGATPGLQTNAASTTDFRFTRMLGALGFLYAVVRL